MPPLRREVLRCDLPVLVDFGAHWCPPCRVMEPIVAELSCDYAAQIKIAKLDCDAERDTAARYNVRGLPTFLFFKDGQPVDSAVGRTAKAELTAKIEALI